ncbi:globin [Xanthomonadaceae bacterium JHOS43]|nr:globin [Xanthomonadaceae bacterium JHOS43]MCX7564386.1 globin [Xanthomonadaceae bacterium XH05]
METFDDLQQSYGRCLREKNFIERFYEIFLASHPDIAPMFEKTDFNTQRFALRRGISVAIEHANGSRLAERTMNQMADTHSRKGSVPVPPSLYRYWVDSLVRTVDEVDPQSSDALLERWRTGMNKVVSTFQAHY